MTTREENPRHLTREGNPSYDMALVMQLLNTIYDINNFVLISIGKVKEQVFFILNDVFGSEMNRLNASWDE